MEKSNVTSFVEKTVPVQVYPMESPVMKVDSTVTANVTKNVNDGIQSTLVPAMDKHNFTSLPQWEFDDVYRLDPQFKQSVSATHLIDVGYNLDVPNHSSYVLMMF